MNKELTKILLVEDEEDIRTIARFALEKRGHFTMKFCSSGQEALNEVESFMPDLILLDVMMPGMDGVATFKALKQMPAVADIPIIFMTAKTQASEIAQYKSLGAIEVISKPFNTSTLPDQLRQLWSEAKNNKLEKATTNNKESE